MTHQTPIEVFTQRLHTGEWVPVYGFSPLNRKQLRRARELADHLRFIGLYAHVRIKDGEALS